MEYHYRHRNIALYELINKENDWRYVDFSLNASIDTDELVKSLKGGTCQNVRLQADWNQYTEKAFKIDIIKDYDEDVRLMTNRPYNESVMHQLYQHYLELVSLRKSQGRKLYNKFISSQDLDQRIRKLVTFDRDGDPIIKPYYQRVALETGYNFAAFFTNETSFPPHRHEEAEIIYTLSSTIQISLNQTIYELKPRDILIIGPREVHSFMTPAAPCDRLALIFKVPNENDIWGYRGKNRITTPHLPYNSHNSVIKTLHSQLEVHLKTIILELNNLDIAYKAAITAHIYHLLYLISRQMVFQSIGADNSKHYSKQVENLERVMRYVSTNYMNDITLKEVADLSNYSIFYFSRLFKDYTGMTFGNFLNQYRIQRSINLLFETNQSITEIAYKCGFNSIKTYNRLFKEIKKISPSAYRKQG